MSNEINLMDNIDLLDPSKPLPEESINNFEALWKSRLVTKYKLEHFIREFGNEKDEKKLKELFKKKKFDIATYVFKKKY